VFNDKNQMNKSTITYFLLISVLSIAFPAIAQNTVGLINYDNEKSWDGYNLIYPHAQPNVYLLNNCGEIVHQWEGESNDRPGNTAYLLEDGRIVITKRPDKTVNELIWAGGRGASIEVKDWDNNIEWTYTLNNEKFRLHHDIEVIDKGDHINVLAIIWEFKSTEEIIAAGRDTSNQNYDILWPETIYEIDTRTSDIVWEWHSWDHLIQNFDESKENYGNISDHPELIDLNYDYNGTGHPDWMHANSIEYFEERDQIMLSIPKFNEVWIIDHSTTTEEASGHSGGNSNMGGDLIFRWGNNQLFGSDSEQKLFFQHDANFIHDFVDPSDPFYGLISIFNNRVTESISSAEIINPTFNSETWKYETNTKSEFLPLESQQTIYHPIDSTRIYSGGLSSIQYLPNGNFLICSGRRGYGFELTPDNQIVWEYITPLLDGVQVSQGSSLVSGDNLTFRMTRYPSEYKAFEGKELSAGGTIELYDGNTYSYCSNSSILSTPKSKLTFFPNPATDHIKLNIKKSEKVVEINLIDLQGIKTHLDMDENKSISTIGITPGIYILNIIFESRSESFRLIIN
jgi:hypothetical protein